MFWMRRKKKINKGHKGENQQEHETLVIDFNTFITNFKILFSFFTYFQNNYHPNLDENQRPKVEVSIIQTEIDTNINTNSIS